MKSNPAQMSAAIPMAWAIEPKMPGALKKTQAQKWRPIMDQAMSHSFETGLGLRRETEANAMASSVIAATSGMAFQLIKLAPGSGHLV